MAASDIDDLLADLRWQKKCVAGFTCLEAEERMKVLARWIAAVEELREAAALWKGIHERAEADIETGKRLACLKRKGGRRYGG